MGLKFFCLSAVLLLAGTIFLPCVQAQDLRAVARVDIDSSSIRDVRRGFVVDLSVSQAIPYRIRFFDGPPRLQISFREIDWTGVELSRLLASAHVRGVATGRDQPGWSHLTLTLDRPYEVETAQMDIAPESGAAQILIRLAATDQTRFTTLAAQTHPPDVLPTKAPVIPQKPMVVLDPGHGGFDPGALNGGYSEAVLMMGFVRELREKLVRSGNYDVVLTRNADIFVPLPQRVLLARRAGADVFLSFHADALKAGQARGATVYTLSPAGSDNASELLAGRLSRADLLAGADLGMVDDSVATALMDLARRDTQPRSERLADHLVDNISAALGGMHKSPRLTADFAVLRAPDIPSVLIELGFLTDERDLENLLNPAWRDQAAEGVMAALDAWTLQDAALQSLMRQ